MPHASGAVQVAVQLLRSDVPIEKQLLQCQEFAASQHWWVSTISPPGHADGVIRLVFSRYVEAVLLPFVNAEALEIEANVVAAGGKVAYCRQPERRRSDLDMDTSAVVVWLHQRRDRSAEDIASFLRTTLGRVNRALRRRGIDRSDS